MAAPTNIMTYRQRILLGFQSFNVQFKTNFSPQRPLEIVLQLKGIKKIFATKQTQSNIAARWTLDVKPTRWRYSEPDVAFLNAILTSDVCLANIDYVTRDTIGHYQKQIYDRFCTVTSLTSRVTRADAGWGKWSEREQTSRESSRLRASMCAHLHVIHAQRAGG